MIKRWIILAVLLAFALIGTASAAQGPIIFPYNGDIVVTFVSEFTANNDEFGMYLPVSQSFGFVDDPGLDPGDTFAVGRCSPDTNVVLFITSPTPHTYYSDLIASGDGNVHVNVVDTNGDGSLYTVSFENQYGDENPDNDFNDVILSVSCTPDPIPTPEFPTMALPAAFIVGMIGAVLFIQRTKEN
jgi:hypothetical protein